MKRIELINEMQKMPTIDIRNSEGKKKYIEKKDAVRLVQKLERDQKLTKVPEWFDTWYKGLELYHKDEYIITQIAPAYYHTSYYHYRKQNNHFNKKQWEYVNLNFVDLVRAVMDGYEVQEEPRYLIKITEWDYIVQDDDGDMYATDINIHNYKYKFTEQEIKSCNEKYWLFRERFEEVSKDEN